MNDQRYALLDMSNLMHRCFHVLPAQLLVADPGLLVSAVAKSCRKLQEDLAVDTLVFCFDGGYKYRKTLFPEYKEKRVFSTEVRNEDGNVAAARDILLRQIQAFRLHHLPSVGAKNICWADGFEADDVIASCVRSLTKARKVYIVSSDEDLYQLIEGTRVVLYKPHKRQIFSEADYRAKHQDLPPCLHASVKAWAGCTSDGIPGLRGVGEVKAAEFVLGGGKNREHFFANIETYNRNIKLTKLPAPGTPVFSVSDQDTPLRWEDLEKTVVNASKPKGIRPV